jgi:mannose-6-phosphate isomerase
MARECVERNAVSADRLAVLRGPASASCDSVERLFPDDADAFFRAERIRTERSPVSFEPDFAVLVVLDGEGRLADEGGDALELRRGSAVLIPFAAGETALSGSLLAVRCRPPISGPKELG